MEDSEVYPIDLSTLQKGSSIDQSRCERITGVSARDSQFPFRLMELRDWIMTESARLGQFLSVRCHANGLVINTDDQAVDYHHKQAKQSERRIFRNLAHMNLIDRNNLTTDRQRELDQKLASWGMKAAALKGRRGGVRIEQDSNHDEQ